VLDTSFCKAGLEQAPKGKVGGIRPNLKRKKWEEQHRWTVTCADLDRIVAAVEPRLSRRAADVLIIS
jgi:hypothetical protein